MEVEMIKQRMQQEPSLRDRVARRAFELFALRGYQIGNEVADWFQAEGEVLQQLIDEEAQRAAMERAAIEPMVPEIECAPIAKVEVEDTAETTKKRSTKKEAAKKEATKKTATKKSATKKSPETNL